MQDREKIRIVIEVEKDDYESLSMLKNLLGIQWKEFLIAGAVWWCDTLNLEQKIEEIRNQVKKFIEEIK
jgi:hypothetical protein